MLFKDQAGDLVAKWENIKEEKDISFLAGVTAIALSRQPDVPEEVLDYLDELLDVEYENWGHAVYGILRYLRTLCEEQRQPQEAKPLILRA